MDHPKIITINSTQKEILYKKTQDLKPTEKELILEIAQKLYHAIEPYTPAAGLAAPQIGISYSIFIYSYDRDPKNLEIVINPNFSPLGKETANGWEACLSVITNDCSLKVAKISRYKKIHVSYLDINLQPVEKILEDFAAKVFQHEYDHLQGIINIDRPDAEIKEFQSRDELVSFMQAVKQEDAKQY